jgi:hypothetical protein
MTKALIHEIKPTIIKIYLLIFDSDIATWNLVYQRVSDLLDDKGDKRHLKS